MYCVYEEDQLKEKDKSSTEEIIKRVGEEEWKS